MKSKQFVMIATITILSVFVICSAQAEIRRLKFSAYTRNYTSDQQISVFVEVFDKKLKNPPDFVDSITVTAPDGTELSMTTANNWLHIYHGYSAYYRADDFDSGVIPGGTYKVKVVDVSGKVLKCNDVVKASFLSPPVISNPIEGSTKMRTPTIRWDSVPGANYYRILLWDETGNQPVYWYYAKSCYVNTTYYKLPLGVLRPNRYYRLRIEARYGHQDLDKRSHSDWVYFYTGDWQ